METKTDSIERKCLNCDKLADAKSSWCSVECFEEWYLKERIEMLNWMFNILLSAKSENSCLHQTRN